MLYNLTGIPSCTRSKNPSSYSENALGFLRFGQGYASFVAALKGQELNQPNHLGYKSRGTKARARDDFSVQELVGCAQLGRLAVGGYFVLRCDFVT